MRRAGRMAAWVGSGDGRRGRWGVRGSPRDRDGGGVDGSMDGWREPGKAGGGALKRTFLRAERAACFRRPRAPLAAQAWPPLGIRSLAPRQGSVSPNSQIPKFPNPQIPKSPNPPIPQFPHPLDPKPPPSPANPPSRPAREYAIFQRARPAASRKRRRRASARGAGVCLLGAEASSASPSPQNAAGGRPLLVGLPPSTSTTAPSGTKQSAQAPCSWGLGASTRSRRLLAAGTAGPKVVDAGGVVGQFHFKAGLVDLTRLEGDEHAVFARVHAGKHA